MLLLTLLLSIAAVFICDGAAQRAEREADRLRALLYEDDTLRNPAPLIRDRAGDRRPNQLPPP